MKVLNAVLVREFYLANSSFFLLVVVIAGGFMRGYEHMALAEFFVSTSMVLSIPITIWVFYTFQVVNFNSERIRLNENEFLFCFALFSFTTQWSLAVRLAALQLLPVFLYAAFLCLMAAKHQLMTSLLLIAASCSILLWFTAFRLLTDLRYPNHEKRVSYFSRSINTRFTKPFPIFFVEWIIRNDVIMLVGTKIFSMLLLAGITILYQTDSYDLRLLSIGIVISAAANASLLQAFHHFENFHLYWLKGLPLTFLKRLWGSVATIIILLIPEVVVLIKNFPEGLTWLECGAAFTLLLSIPMLFYGGLYTKGRNQQEIMPVVFALVMIWFLMILSTLPIMLIAAGNISAGLYLYKKYYYSFEYVSKE